MCPGPRLKRTFALPKQLLTESRLSFQSEARDESPPFSTCMRFWRDAGDVDRLFKKGNRRRLFVPLWELSKYYPSAMHREAGIISMQSANPAVNGPAHA